MKKLFIIVLMLITSLVPNKYDGDVSENITQNTNDEEIILSLENEIVQEVIKQEPKQEEKIYCVDGGSIHIYGDGANEHGYYKTWDEAFKAYEYGNEFLAEFKANRPEYQHMAEMIYFGYTMNYGMGLPGSYEAKVAAACTQQYVWETLGNAPARDSWNGSYMSSGLYASWLAQTEGYYNQYHSDESEIVDIAKKVKHIVVNNEPLESYVKLVKKDFKTNKNVSLNSATFKIKATKDIYDRAAKKIIWKKGEFINQKLGRTTYDSFTTNAKNIIVPDNSYNDKLDNLGSITVPLTSPVGSYEIEEIKTPQGFLQLEESVKFKIDFKTLLYESYITCPVK